MPNSSPFSLVDFEEHNPFREVDWRWRYACELAERAEVRSDTTFYGETIREAARFLRHQAKMSGPRTEFHTDLEKVQAIHLENGRTRLLIEAYLLARFKPEHITPYVGIEPFLVEFYERLFFNVLDRLDASLYIAKAVIGSLKDPMTVRRLLRWFAYHGGPAVVRRLGDDFVNYIRLIDAGESPPTDSWISPWIDAMTTRRWTVEQLKFYIQHGPSAGVPPAEAVGPTAKATAPRKPRRGRARPRPASATVQTEAGRTAAATRQDWEVGTLEQQIIDLAAEVGQMEKL